MAGIAVETTVPVEVTPGILENRQIKDHAIDNRESEEHREYMRGWALACLTLAFMSICFVLALDNTILGSWFPLAHQPEP